MEGQLIEVVELSLPGRTGGQRRAAAASAMRAELAWRLRRPESAVVIERSPLGKPRLADAEPALRFSLAHSRERGLLAVSAEREVGIDLEPLDPRRPHERLAHRWFTQSELEQVLAATSPQQRIAVFYRLWVAKEACVKATGEGLAALRACSVGSDGLVSWTQPRLGSAVWRVQSLALGEGWAAAVAAPGTDWRAVMRPLAHAGG